MRRDEHFDVGERAQLDVDVASGNLQVRVGSGGAIRVSIDSPKADELEISQMGDTVSISESARWLSRSRSIRMVVEVPMRADLTIRGASLNVLLGGTFGGVRCRTASGGLQIDEVDRLEVSTASGDVRVGSINGDAGFNTASGDVMVVTMRGRLTAQLASGDLVADAVGASVDVGTASGDVRIGRCDGSDINVKTISGNIRLGLPPGIRVEPEISTMSGKVALPAAAAVGANRSVERRSVRVRLRTVSGDIRIDRVG
jgi:DUF4097 and DUF4098 domain-containing protein YvlB